jgi:hypothetical protein
MARTKRVVSNQNAKKLTRKAPRGQAMVEYSVVSHFLLMGGSAVMMKVIPRLFEAINMFYDSVYTVIETAAV